MWLHRRVVVLSVEQEPPQRAQPEDVGAVIDPRIQVPNLGRDVARGPAGGVLFFVRVAVEVQSQAEIDDACVAPAARRHGPDHIGGLQVAMNQPRAVDRPERAAELQKQRSHELGGQWAMLRHQAMQVDALQELEHQERATLRLPTLDETWDMGRADSQEGFRFAPKTLRTISPAFAAELHGDLTLAERVSRAKHDAHGAPADPLLETVEAPLPQDDVVGLGDVQGPGMWRPRNRDGVGVGHVRRGRIRAGPPCEVIGLRRLRGAHLLGFSSAHHEKSMGRGAAPASNHRGPRATECLQVSRRRFGAPRPADNLRAPSTADEQLGLIQETRSPA